MNSNNTNHKKIEEDNTAKYDVFKDIYNYSKQNISGNPKVHVKFYKLYRIIQIISSLEEIMVTLEVLI